MTGKPAVWHSLRTKLGIDPGNNTGVAWGFDGRVVACYLAEPGDALVMPAALAGAGPIHCVIELPKFYPPKTYGSPAKAYNVGNSLIREAVTLGGFKRNAEQLGATVEEVLPRTWKGTLPKKSMLRLIWERLDVNERAQVKALGLPASLVHNVLDAIGLVLWSQNRLDIRRFQ